MKGDLKMSILAMFKSKTVSDQYIVYGVPKKYCKRNALSEEGYQFIENKYNLFTKLTYCDFHAFVEIYREE